MEPQDAIDVVRESMNKLKGKAMSNLPDGCSDKEISDAGEATPATDNEAVDFIMRLVPKATDVEVLDYDDDIDSLCICLWINRGDVER